MAQHFPERREIVGCRRRLLKILANSSMKFEDIGFQNDGCNRKARVAHSLPAFVLGEFEKSLCRGYTFLMFKMSFVYI